MTNKDEDEAFEHEMSAHPWGYGQRRDQTFEFAMAAIRHRGLWAEATVVMKEIERLKAERDALQANAEKGTEYVLAHINQALRAERDAAVAVLETVLRIPFMSDADLEQLQINCKAAIDAARGET